MKTEASARPPRDPRPQDVGVRVLVFELVGAGQDEVRGPLDDASLGYAPTRHLQSRRFSLAYDFFRFREVTPTTSFPTGGEGSALAVLVRDFPPTPHQTRDNTTFPRPLRKSEARLHLACPCGKADEDVEPTHSCQPRLGLQYVEACALLRTP